MKLFKKKEKKFKDSTEFVKNTRKAINLFLNSNDLLNDKMILELFQKNGISKVDSTEILLFLPIAFTRQLFNSLKWPDTYIEFYDKNQVEKKFVDSVSYQIIWQETEKYFQDLPVSKEVMKIASRSAEFNAMNDLLLQNPDAKAEDIILSKTIIVR